MRPIFFLILLVSVLATAQTQPSQPSASAPQHFKLPATLRKGATGLTGLQGVRTTAMVEGVAPMGKGEPGIGEKTPVLGSTLKPTTALMSVAAI
jgi:hypothetical protein